MVVNMNMRGTEEGNINQYLSDTIANVFPEVYTIDVKGSTNRELFASDQPMLLQSFEENLALETDPELGGMMTEVAQELKRYEAGNYCMTDDRAPVELLGMRVIDELIVNEVAYYKVIYEQEGIRGLIDSL